MHESSSRAQMVFAIAIIASAIAFIVIPAWQLLSFGPFSWHIAQPEFQQGGAEALGLMGLLALVQQLARRSWRMILTAVISELYLRRHGVDIAIAVDLVYFELCIGLGAWAMRLTGNVQPNDIPAYLCSFIIGLCVWSVCAWMLSAFGFGSVRDLRLLTLVLFIPALSTRCRPWLFFVHERVAEMPKRQRACAAILLGWFLIQAARSAVAIDFDGLWYGLRGEYVLVGSGSPFISSGLVSPVYYYPKLYELFLIPVSGLGSSSAITGLTILVSSMLAAAGYEILRRLGTKDAALRLLGVSVCMTLPAIANQMLQSKGDMLAALLLACAWLKAAEFIARRERAPLIWLFALLLLSTQARLSAVPFAVALAAATLLASMIYRKEHKTDAPHALRLAGVALMLAIVVTALLTARTILLAGLPTVGPDQLVKLWLWLGFEFKFPAGTLQWNLAKDWTDTFPLLIDYLFRPQRLGHIVITWVGNVWIWVAVIALLAVGFARRRPQIPVHFAYPGMALILTGIALMFCLAFNNNRGGDGNYFMPGLLAATLLGVAAVLNVTQTLPKARQLLLVGLCFFSLSQAAYSFMSAAWTTGTRTFDLAFNRGVRSLHHKKRAVLDNDGLVHIADYLRSRGTTAHIVGYVDYEPGYCLPGIYEGLEDISFSHRELVDDRTKFLTYVAKTNVEFLIVPHEDHVAKSIASMYVSPMISKLAREMSENPSTRIVHDVNYDMYELPNSVRMLAIQKAE